MDNTIYGDIPVVQLRAHPTLTPEESNADTYYPSEERACTYDMPFVGDTATHEHGY